jgi:hypothetical protein
MRARPDGAHLLESIAGASPGPRRLEKGARRRGAHAQTGRETEVEKELEVGASSSEPSDGHGELGNGSRLKEIGEGELGPKARARSRG